MVRGDQLDRTARQVRIDGLVVHKLTGSAFHRPLGKQYRTACGKTLTAFAGAILTTRRVGCSECLNPAGLGLGCQPRGRQLIGQLPPEAP